jgi:hypothetical protein
MGFGFLFLSLPAARSGVPADGSPGQQAAGALLKETPATIERAYLMSIAYSNSVSKTSTVRGHLGRNLARQARKGSATERALLAVEATGADVYRLTPEQATTLAGANHTYVAQLRRMTPLERAAVATGRLKLSDCVNRRNKPVTNATLDKLLVAIGADRVLAALDRLTRPVAA